VSPDGAASGPALLAAALAAAAVAAGTRGARPPGRHPRPGVAPGARLPGGRVVRRAVLPGAAGAAVLVVLLGDLRIALWALVALVGVVGVERLVRASRRRRDAEARAERVVALCGALAGDLAAGRPVGTALRQAAEDWPELAPVAAADALGSDVPQAWRRLADRPGGGGLRVVAAAWTVSAHAGAGLADALHRLADTLRTERETHHVVATELASARATARVMALLPLAVLAMASGVGGDPWGFLLTTVPGLVCLVLGSASALLGVWWIERLAAGAER